MEHLEILNGTGGTEMNKDDVMVEMLLISPHNSEMYFQRSDGSYYMIKNPEKIITELPENWIPRSKRNE